MEEQNKIRVVLYESPDRISRVDALAKQKELSRSALYRRAMREMLDRQSQSKEEATPNDHRD